MQTAVAESCFAHKACNAFRQHPLEKKTAFPSRQLKLASLLAAVQRVRELKAFNRLRRKALDQAKNQVSSAWLSHANICFRRGVQG